MSPPPQQPPRRLLALDPGSRRVGVAISDELGAFAHARPAILGADPVGAVAQLVHDEGVAEVVVGLPLALAGDDTDQTRRARAFAAELRQRLPVPVSVWDERLSSVQAGRSPGASRSGRSRGSGGAGARQRRSGELDSAAAALVLQAVLDSRRNGVQQQ